MVNFHISQQQRWILVFPVGVLAVLAVCGVRGTVANEGGGKIIVLLM